MDPWQSNYIRINLPKLIHLTTCNSVLLTFLESKEILGKSDIAELNAIPNTESKTAKLYEILETRVDSYRELLHGLNKSKQSGAHKILFEGLQSNSNGRGQGSPSGETAESTIKFITPLRYMNDFLGDDNNQLLVITTYDTKFTRKRIQDTVDQVTFLDSRFVNAKTVKEIGGLAAVECEDVTEFLGKITNITNSAKVILITEQDTKIVSRAVKSFSIQLILVHDDITWTDLDSSSQQILLQQRSVSFQGRVIPLSSIVPEECLYDKMKGRIMAELLNNKCPEVVNDSVPPPLNYYLNRTIVCRGQISPRILDIRSDDVFVFKGIEWAELTKLVKGASTERSSCQTKGLTVKFVLLEYEEHFDKIGKLTKTAHLINFKEGKLEWERSHGSLSLIQQFIVDEKEQDVVDEDAFMIRCLQSEQPVCISDTPGMGKSILLANLARRTLNKHPNRVVRFIVLREFIQEIQQQKKVVNGDLVSFVGRVIAKLGSDNEFGMELIKHSLTSPEVLCELMFDGFDEVLPDQVKLAKQLLNLLAKLENTRIYVTARPHLLHELEQVLGVLGHNIMAFQEADQIEFLLKYWEDKGAVRNERLEEFAKSSLAALKNNMTSFERDITGIPLQCALLAEVHSEDAVIYSNVQNQSQPTAHFGPNISINSIFEMYKKLMSVRFARVEQLESSRWKHRFCSLFSKGRLHQKMVHTHMYAAVKLLFPNYAETFRELLLGRRSCCDLPVDKLCRIGILEQKNLLDHTPPRFVHRTFAEYFLGLFAVQLLKRGSDLEVRLKNEQVRASSQLFLNDILSSTEKFESPLVYSSFDEWDSIQSFECQYPVICYFINAHLGDVWFHSANQANCSSRWVLDVDRFKQHFVMSVAADHPFLCRLLAENFFERYDKSVKVKLHEGLPWADILLLAAKLSSTTFMKQLCTNVKNRTGRQFEQLEDIMFPSSSSSSNTILTPLHVAAQRGNYTSVAFLLEKINFRNPKHQYWIQNLVHYCVTESRGHNSNVITHKQQILKLLVEINPQLLEEKRSGGITPLLEENVHLDLIKCMINLGADVNVISDQGNSLLSVLLSKRLGQPFITLQEFCGIVKFLKEKNFSKFNEPNSQNRRTCLHAAAAHFDLDKATLLQFFQSEANFNAVDERGESVLFYAVRGKRSLDFIKDLIGFGAEWAHTNRLEQTILHAACESGHVDAVRYFVKVVADVNKADKDGNTPLHAAMCARSQVHLLIQKLLYEDRNMDKNARNRQSNTPLLHGLQNGKGLTLEMIRLSEEQGKMSAAQASAALACLLGNGNIVIFEWDKDMVAVADYFLQKGGPLKSKKIDSLWESEQIKINLNRIYELTDCTEKLLSELEQRYVLTKGDKVSIQNEAKQSKSHRLYDILKLKVGSYERLMVSLIAAKQTRPFVIMQQCLQIDNNESARYVTAPPGLVDFIGTEGDRLLFIKSTNANITLHRIRDTIGPYIRIIAESELTTSKSLHEDSGLNAVVCSTKRTVNNLLHDLRNHMQCKLVVIINPYLALALEAVPAFCVVSDEIKWRDLSSSFQSQLLPCVALRFQREGCASKYLKEPSTLGGELLTKLIDRYQECTTDCGIAKSCGTRVNLISVPETTNKVAAYSTLGQLGGELLIKLIGRCDQEYTASNNNVAKSSSSRINLIRVPETNKVSAYARFVHFMQCMYPKELTFPVNYTTIPLYAEGELTEGMTGHWLLAKVLSEHDLSIHIIQKLVKSSWCELNIVLDVLHEPPNGKHANTLINLVKVLNDSLEHVKIWVVSSETLVICEMGNAFGELLVQDYEEALLEHELGYILRIWKDTSVESSLRRKLAMECLESYKINSQGHAELVCSEGFLNEILGNIRLFQLSPTNDPSCYCLLLAKTLELRTTMQPSGATPELGNMLQEYVRINVLKTDSHLSQKLRYQMPHNMPYYGALFYSAISQYYPEWVIIFKYPMEFQTDAHLLLETGVMTFKNEKLEFVHECYASYLIALLIVEETFSNFVNSETLARFFLTAALSTGPVLSEQLPSLSLQRFTNPFLAYFLNSLCSQSRYQKRLQTLFMGIPFNQNYFLGFMKAAVVASFRGLFEVAQLRLTFPHTPNVTEELHHILRLSVAFSDLETLKIISTYVGETWQQNQSYSLRLISASSFKTLLAYAVSRGDGPVFQYLIDSPMFKKTLNITPELLHKVVKNTLNDDVSVIKGKLEIVHKLVSMCPSIVNTRVGDDLNHPLHEKNIHLELLKELTELGVPDSSSSDEVVGDVGVSKPNRKVKLFGEIIM